LALYRFIEQEKPASVVEYENISYSNKANPEQPKDPAHARVP